MAAQSIVWIVIGLLGGTLAGRIAKGERGGFGVWRNLGLGLVGAVLGGWLFQVFDLLPSLDRIAVSLRDIVAAVAGSLIVLVLLWAWTRSRPQRPA
jgi:uncharacterized membrane protein YeaQ/YmgE (transglycosylase-associated protein family)